MPLELVTIPCLSDNYAFLLGDAVTGTAALIDAPEAGPVNAVLDARGWRLTTVLLTHHHDDHVQGLAGLKTGSDLRVIGAAADAHRLPPLTQQVNEGDTVDVLGSPVHVFDVSGHTIGHIAFHLPGEKLLFSADSLMAMGCGRLFEGTPAQMWESMQKLRALPGDTVVCSGHEYTASNMKFALSLEEPNAALKSRSNQIDVARKKGQPTVPSILADECATNPFLRADVPSLMAAVGMAGADPVAVFAEVRGRKDRF